jgi:hypothetical protein
MTLLDSIPGTMVRSRWQTSVTRTFCSDCGTSIRYVDQGISNEVYIALGFFDCPENFPPEAHAYWSEKMSWIAFADNLPRIEGYSRERDPAVGTPTQRG